MPKKKKMKITTRSASSVRTPSEPYEPGTVGWLIEELKKYDPNSLVMSADQHNGRYYEVFESEVRRIDEGDEVVPALLDLKEGEELPGIDAVCLLPY